MKYFASLLSVDGLQINSKNASTTNFHSLFFDEIIDQSFIFSNATWNRSLSSWVLFLHSKIVTNYLDLQ